MGFQLFIIRELKQKTWIIQFRQKSPKLIDLNSCTHLLILQVINVRYYRQKSGKRDRHISDKLNPADFFLPK